MALRGRILETPNPPLALRTQDSAPADRPPTRHFKFFILTDWHTNVCTLATFVQMLGVVTGADYIENYWRNMAVPGPRGDLAASMGLERAWMGCACGREFPQPGRCMWNIKIDRILCGAPRVLRLQTLPPWMF